MNTQHSVIKDFYPNNIPMIDGEFDSFEWSDDLDFILHEAENATLYHASLHQQE